MAKHVDYIKLLKDAPRDCWVAINEEESVIVGRGETMTDAVVEAEKAGISDPIVLWSSKERIPSVFLD